MTEKELIRMALESRLDDPRIRSSGEIIEAEAKGAHAHIRRRRFTFVTVAAAAALAVSAAVLGFRKLADTKITPGADVSSSVSDSSRDENKNGKVIKLCDFSGATEGGNVDLTRLPDNMNDYRIFIKDSEVTAQLKEGENNFELIGAGSYNAVIKVFTADVSGDGKADICIETKPTYTAEESMVYLFDLYNQYMQFYYVPGKLNFKLKEENGILMLGMKSPDEKDYEYIKATMEGISRFEEAKTEWLAENFREIRENTAEVWMSYSSGSDDTDKNYVGDKIYTNCSAYMEKTADREDPAEKVDAMLALLGGENAAYILQPSVSASPRENGHFYGGLGAVDAETSGETLYYDLLDADGKEISSYMIARMKTGELALSVIVKDKYGKEFNAWYYAPDDLGKGTPMIDAVTGKCSNQVIRKYYCEDISAMGITSPAQRMLLTPGGEFAIGYHVEKTDGKTELVIDSVQPENAEGRLSVNLVDSRELLSIEFDGKGSPAPGQRFELDMPNESEVTDHEIYSTAKGDWFTARSDSLYLTFVRSENGESTEYTDSAMDYWYFGQKGFEKEFSLLADFTEKYSVSRLENGEPIVFEKQLRTFPGDVTVSITDSSVTVDAAGEKHTVAENVQVSRVYASDLNSDGRQEVIVECCKSDPRIDGTVRSMTSSPAELYPSTRAISRMRAYILTKPVSAFRSTAIWSLSKLRSKESSPKRLCPSRAHP